MKGMVDVSDKEVVKRTAVAAGRIVLGEASMEAIRSGTVRKGEVYQSAKIAALQGVKSTPSLLAFCHPLPVESVELDMTLEDHSVSMECKVIAHYRTGVEMEALMGVSAALLTVWDMLKYLEKDDRGQYPGTAMEDLRVISKTKEG